MIKRTTMTRGSGMTRKKYMRIQISSKDSKADWDVYLLKRQNFEDDLKDNMEFCRQLLRENGLPDTAIVKLGENVESIESYVLERKGHDEDSDVGYAARILWHLHWIFNPPTPDGLWDLVFHGHSAGSLATEANIKLGKWGKLAEQQFKYSEIGRALSAENRAAKRDEIAAEFEVEATGIRQKDTSLRPHGVAVLIHNRRKRENSKLPEDEQLPNQSIRRIADKIKHLWE